MSSIWKATSQWVNEPLTDMFRYRVSVAVGTLSEIRNTSSEAVEVTLSTCRMRTLAMKADDGGTAGCERRGLFLMKGVRHRLDMDHRATSRACKVLPQLPHLIAFATYYHRSTTCFSSNDDNQCRGMFGRPGLYEHCQRTIGMAVADRLFFTDWSSKSRLSHKLIPTSRVIQTSTDSRHALRGSLLTVIGGFGTTVLMT